MDKVLLHIKHSQLSKTSVFTCENKIKNKHLIRPIAYIHVQESLASVLLFHIAQMIAHTASYSMHSKAKTPKS